MVILRPSRHKINITTEQIFITIYAKINFIVILGGLPKNGYFAVFTSNMKCENFLTANPPCGMGRIIFE